MLNCNVHFAKRRTNPNHGKTHTETEIYNNIFRLGVGCIIVFVGGVRGGVGACVCLGSCCYVAALVLCGRAASIRGRDFRGFGSVGVGNGRYLGKFLRSDGLFLYQ